jgi:glycosyltransferase involved in cell wall biosynthesis
MPRLVKQWPQAKFHIVGRSPTAAVRALAGKTVAVSGTVPDVRPYLQHAAVAVAPLRVARGIQNKLLEAMAMGVPVVASPACVAPLRAHVGREVLTAADATDFAREIEGLLRNDERAKAIGAAGRERVLDSYSWSAHLRQLDDRLAMASAA